MNCIQKFSIAWNMIIHAWFQILHLLYSLFLLNWWITMIYWSNWCFQSLYHLYWCWIEVFQKEFEYEDVYHELYNYGHFWQFFSLIWLLLQVNWFMKSIWFLLLNWWLICMWKSNSHILLWSFEVNDVNGLFYLMMCPCGQMLKNEVLMLLSHYFD